MKKLIIDLELLVQSFSFNNDDLGKEYLDTNTGDIINIPYEVNSAAQGELEEDELSDWQKELLQDAKAIKEDEEDRYLLLPPIEDSFFYEAMVEFTREKISSDNLKKELLDALKGNNPMRDFKSIIFKYQHDLDKWQDYEEEKSKEYVIKWLLDRGIEIE